MRVQAGSVNDFVFFDPGMASRLPQTRRARQRTIAQKTTRAKPAASKEKFAFDFSSTVIIWFWRRDPLFAHRVCVCLLRRRRWRWLSGPNCSRSPKSRCARMRTCLAIDAIAFIRLITQCRGKRNLRKNRSKLLQPCTTWPRRRLTSR